MVRPAEHTFEGLDASQRDLRRRVAQRAARRHFFFERTYTGAACVRPGFQPHLQRAHVQTLLQPVESF